VNVVVCAVVTRKDGSFYFFYKEIMFLLISDMILVIEVYIDMVLNLSITNNKEVKFQALFFAHPFVWSVSL
jgi:hypothetical protein